MLVLSRKYQERIVIDERIVVTIVRIGRNNVRVGVEAPTEVQIRRDEVPARVRPVPTSAPDTQATRPAC